MFSLMANSINGLDALKRYQKKVRLHKQNAWQKRYRQTEKGQASSKRQSDKRRERIADDPEYRERIRVQNQQYDRSPVSKAVRCFRNTTRRYNEPIYVFYINECFVFAPEKVRETKSWHYSVINGERIKRTFSSLNQKYPDCFIGGYDTNAKFEDIKEDFVYKMNGSPVTAECTGCRRQKPITEFHKDRHNSNGYRRRCKDCNTSARGALSLKKHKQPYNLSAIPSLGITKNCPCDGCEYEKPCEQGGFDCECYRCWMKGLTYKKFPKVPDRYHLDGSKLGPGVI